MAICQIFENSEVSQEQWEQLSAHLAETGPVPAEGARLLIAGPAEPGWLVVTVWDSEEARDRFIEERLAPAYHEMGLSLDSAVRRVFDVQTLTAGDLTGTPQAA